MNEEQQQNEEQKMNEKQQPASQKLHRRFYQAKYHRWKFLLSHIKRKAYQKIITEVLLILPLYLIWFFISQRFRYLIKIKADVENTLNDDDFFGDIDDTSKKHLKKAMINVGLYNFARGLLKTDQFFGDTVDISKEGIEQHRERECLNSVTGSGKAYLLAYKWTQENVNKARNEAINKTYALCKQCELNEKGEKLERPQTHVINLYSTGIFRIVKIRDAKKLQQDIENDPIIKDQMVNLGCLLVCNFGNFLAPILVATHTVNNLCLGNKLEDECSESD